MFITQKLIIQLDLSCWIPQRVQYKKRGINLQAMT